MNGVLLKALAALLTALVLGAYAYTWGTEGRLLHRIERIETRLDRMMDWWGIPPVRER